jgi:hypothetical protein
MRSHPRAVPFLQLASATSSTMPPSARRYLYPPFPVGRIVGRTPPVRTGSNWVIVLKTPLPRSQKMGRASRRRW